jgi:hypothetical protein
MGREIKRVALDFDWPLNKVWRGYLLPQARCPECGYLPDDNGEPIPPETGPPKPDCETCYGDTHRPKEEPPGGEGWQVWETVSEGSPITPVFPTPEALVDHLCAYGDGWSQKPPSRQAAEAFVKSGWVPSMVMVDGRCLSGIDAAALLVKDRT